MQIKLIDPQGVGLSVELFLNKETLINSLADYHDADWNDEEFLTIYDWLDNFKTEDEKLNAIIEFGNWDYKITN